MPDIIRLLWLAPVPILQNEIRRSNLRDALYKIICTRRCMNQRDLSVRADT